MFDSFVKKIIVRRVFEALSPFQSFLCILYALGYDFPEIAAEFHVSLRTVQRWFKEIHSDVSRILEI